LTALLFGRWRITVLNVLENGVSGRIFECAYLRKGEEVTGYREFKKEHYNVFSSFLRWLNAEG
jgi:hypothetical protein